MATYKIIGGDQKEYGPATHDELLGWIAEGRLSGQSLVQSEGSAQWQRLEAFAEFTDALRAQAGLPTVATPHAHPANAEAWSAQILARHSEIHIGRCLSNAWKLCFANFGLLFGATFIVWLLGNLSAVVQLVSHFLGLPPAWNFVTGAAAMLWGIVYFILHGVFYGGLYLIFLNRLRGQPASIGDVFGGFKLGFVQLLLVGVVSALLTMVGFVVCVLPGIYLIVAWAFSKALVADKRLEFWSAMELSRKVATRVWFDLFVLLLVAFLPTILANVLVQIKLFAMIWPAVWDMVSSGQPDVSRIQGLVMQMTHNSQFVAMVTLPRFILLLNLPFVLGALMYAYENLFGARPTAAA
jgi:hypothetical protein